MLIDWAFDGDELLDGASAAAHGVYAVIAARLGCLGRSSAPIDRMPAWVAAEKKALEELYARGALVRVRDGEIALGALRNPRAASHASPYDAPPVTASSSATDRPKRVRPHDPNAAERARAWREANASERQPERQANASERHAERQANATPNASERHAGLSEKREENQRETIETPRADVGANATERQANATPNATERQPRPLASIGDDGVFGSSSSTYVELVKAATGTPHSGLRHADYAVLTETFNAHAPGLRGEALVRWLTDTFAAFVASGFPAFGGHDPRNFAKWLNNGRPQTKKPGAARTKAQQQPYDPNAPWMQETLEETA